TRRRWWRWRRSPRRPGGRHSLPGPSPMGSAGVGVRVGEFLDVAAVLREDGRRLVDGPVASLGVFDHESLADGARAALETHRRIVPVDPFLLEQLLLDQVARQAVKLLL